MLSRVKNAITKINSLSTPKKLLILLVVAIIIVAVLISLDIIPKETVFPSSISPPIPELQPEPEVEYEQQFKEFESEPLVYLGSGACVGDNQEIPEGHCDENPECTAIGRQKNGCWHLLKGDAEPDEGVRDTYKFGLFKKTAAGYESLL
ncbi:hypothetical protein EhV310 [Emiliania huxleyi virus 86]|uniref:Putative membrane protein n=2 Tax=Emiliania huxleyi virus 86 TaxID=181082 RepID=Q4A2G9_EHV8U|nr:hypothetical protein EhV310 [Emiliania huxleyi virus 86]AEO97760.1 hypothetical protein ENVG_00227 [Emiliania huxleyi virus 84]AEP15238.1 hypothetical protein EOVG_00301 [Emiliania huxleyi virus 88]AHA55927.1 putative membrane protein [Emiliania huxleyi virus 164]CAI65737.1 putative membrane protein [Emiliania huxleyi virus 86]